jgi:hypothetical protein
MMQPEKSSMKGDFIEVHFQLPNWFKTVPERYLSDDKMLVTVDTKKLCNSKENCVGIYLRGVYLSIFLWC